MRIDLNKFHTRAKNIYDTENLRPLKQRVVAFVLDSKGRILTEGANTYTKTHPDQKRASLAQNHDEHKCYMHAEIRALTRLSYKQLDKPEHIVVIRMDTDKNLIPGKPCVICAAVIKQFGIESVIHS